MMYTFIFVLVCTTTLMTGSSIPDNISRKTGVYANSGPRDEPIGTTPPIFPGGTIANDAPPGPFLEGFQPPFPTDSWWSGFTVGNQDANVAGPFPFQTCTDNFGLIFGLSDVREFDGASIRVPTQQEWIVGIAGLQDVKSNHKALGWDTQTVSLRYTSEDGSTMDTFLVPGSPYMTFKFENAAVVISSRMFEIELFEWVEPGTKARVTNGGGTYLIYVVSGGPIELTADMWTLTSPPGFSGTLRFAKVKEPGEEVILDAHSNSYPTSLIMSYEVVGDVSTQTWTWDVVGDKDNLLLLSWPHHRKALQAPNFVDLQYLTLKGYMKGVIGNEWKLRHDLPTISWFPANNVDPSCLVELERILEAEIGGLEVLPAGDFYFFGGAFGRAAQLATIAEHIGRTDLIEPVLNILRQSVEPWFDPTHRPAATFETGWGGFINGDGWNNTWVDFGNAYYNDHHFHYGYLLHGTAVIAKYDAVWYTQHSDFFIHVARNIGNPSPNDPHYTVTRHMDWFAGHSWASGIANGAGPRDQESSGEAINGYYGLLLWAEVMQHKDFIDYARLLLAIEIAGAQTYWQLQPIRHDPDTPYPEQVFRDLSTVGNVMDWQTGAWLFWGDQRTQIAAIQILPLTPIGQYTYDVDWITSVLPYCQAEIDDITIGDAFKSVIIAAYSKVNPELSYSYSTDLYEWGTGNSASNQLYFISTRPSNGPICSAAIETPEGVFYIQDTTTGKFVSVGEYDHLAASTVADVLSTKFKLAFKPGGSSIQALSNGQYVSAVAEGDSALIANRPYVAGYETFRWQSQPDGSYELLAMVNRARVSTVANGELINNGEPSRYRLVEASTEIIQIPTSGSLRNVQTGQFVLHTAEDPILRATGGNPEEGVKFSFERVPESSDDNPLYIIRSQLTDLIVTADVAGSVPLSAMRVEAQAWEHFKIVPYKNSYIIVHFVSGHATAVQPDNTLIDNDDTLNDVALWVIE